MGGLDAMIEQLEGGGDDGGGVDEEYCISLYYKNETSNSTFLVVVGCVEK
jgi:hypothetical protein